MPLRMDNLQIEKHSQEHIEAPPLSGLKTDASIGDLQPITNGPAPIKEGTTAWLQVLGAFCLNLNTWLVSPGSALK